MIAILPTVERSEAHLFFCSILQQEIFYSFRSYASRLLDFELSICLNASLKIKSSCVIDAFSQAIESFWSVGANSIKFAKKQFI